MSQTAQDQANLLKKLPALLKLLTTAQGEIASISANLEIAQTGVLRSTLPSENGEPRFTEQFVDSSSEFAVCIDEISDNLERVCESIHGIEEATQAVVFGVRHQLQVEPRSDNDSLEDETLNDEAKTLLRYGALAAL